MGLIRGLIDGTSVCLLGSGTIEGANYWDHFFISVSALAGFLPNPNCFPKTLPTRSFAPPSCSEIPFISAYTSKEHFLSTVDPFTRAFSTTVPFINDGVRRLQNYHDVAYNWDVLLDPMKILKISHNNPGVGLLFPVDPVAISPGESTDAFA